MTMGQSDLRDQAFTAERLHAIGRLVPDPELAARRAGFAGRAGATEPGGPVTAAPAVPGTVDPHWNNGNFSPSSGVHVIAMGPAAPPRAPVYIR